MSLEIGVVEACIRKAVTETVSWRQVVLLIVTIVKVDACRDCVRIVRMTVAPEGSHLLCSQLEVEDPGQC